MDVSERADLYIKAFPNYCPLQIFNNRFYGIWIMGNSYGHKSTYYGEFPNSLKKRILCLFPDCRKILHMFSGQIADKDTFTYDVNPKLNPTICDDIRNLHKYKKQIKHMDLIISDPPYATSDFEKYGLKPFNKPKVMKELGNIMRPGSFLVWLDTRVPMYNKLLLELVGYIGIIVSTNHRIRCLSFYKKI
jgi:hypothetical protein